MASLTMSGGMWQLRTWSTVGIDISDSQDQKDATADGVLDVIENGDSQDGDDFGKEVADTASDSKSTGGLDTEKPDEDEDGAGYADGCRP